MRHLMSTAIGALLTPLAGPRPVKRSSPRAVLKPASDRGRRKAQMRIATAIRVMLEQQAQANARLAGLRLEEGEALICFKHLPSVHELAASASALAKAQRTLPRAA